MADRKKYQLYLQDSDFIKYSIICSSLVWDKSYTEIASALEITKAYVQKIIQKWKEDADFSDKRINNGGHNHKITQESLDSMVDLIEDSRNTSLRNMANKMKDEMDLEVTPQAIGKALKAIGYVKIKPYRIPALSPDAIRKRREYAEKHLEDKFSNVAFSDECMFQLSENRQLSWWNPNTESRPILEDPYKQNKVMIWGAISRKGKTDIYYWKVSKDLTVDTYEYTQCLNEVLIAKMDQLYGIRKWRFVQDNARPHTAANTKIFLENNDIRALNHPPYSPDLNPIELVWAYLKRRVMVKVYDTLDDVLAKVFEEWYAIPTQMLNNLIDAHCERIREVYELGGKFC